MATLLSILLAASVAGSVAQSPSGYRSALTHVDSKGGFTKTELLHRAAHRSRLRAATMLSGYSTTSSNSTSRPRLQSGQAEYLMNLAIGTPPVPFVALADTGSNLIWTQCQPCKLCFPQDTPIYNTSASTSFSPEPCSSAMCQSLQSDNNCTLNSQCMYYYDYADGAYSAGVLGRETLTLGTTASAVSASDVAFGCGSDNGGDSFNSTGTVGLSRGPLSLVAQLGFGKFSYCLTDFFLPSLSSPVLFGSLAELEPRGGDTMQTTPLVQNMAYPSWYYISLEGISLGDTRLPIPEQAFQLRNDGTGGMVVDSGTTFTILEGSAFMVVLDHVAEVLGHPAVNSSSFEIPCFPAPSGQRQLPPMPDMVMHFAGGADMRLHRDNYMSFDEEGSSFCLNMLGDDATLSGSVLGNFQQQNIQMLFDITVGQLSFAPADCSIL
nr:aspartic proteinase nepenthesin-1-like [Lolium perenne]